MELESPVFGVNTLQKKQCASTTSGVKGAKKCKYCQNYLTFGLTYTVNEYTDGLCLFCKKTFFNTFLASAKFKRHFETSHLSYQNKEIAFFKRKLKFF